MYNSLIRRLTPPAKRGITLTLFLLFAAIFSAAQTVGSSSASPASPIAAGSGDRDDIKVTFDDKTAGVMYIESNGKRFKVNSITKTVELMMPASPAAGAVAASSADAQIAAANQDEKEDLYVFESGDEPYDYRLVNVPTAKKVPKGTWNINFTHRFAQPIHPISESGKNLLGFDSMSMSSFGVMYGITDKFYVNAYRSPLCQQALCKTIEIGAGYHFIDQNERSPIGVNVYGSVEGSDNFSSNFTYNLQTMISGRIGKRVFLHFSPALHINSNGDNRFDPDPNNYFPPATAAAAAFDMPNHTFSFGTGISVRITPSVSGVFEFTPRVGFKLGNVQPIYDSNFNVTRFENISYPEMGIGVMYTRGRHAFTVTLSNTQTTTTSRYNSSNLVLKPKDLVIGFNLFRRW